MGYLGFTRSEKLILVCSAALSALAPWYARKALRLHKQNGKENGNYFWERERERV